MTQIIERSKPSIRRIPSVSPFRAKRSIRARKAPFAEQRLDLSGVKRRGRCDRTLSRPTHRAVASEFHENSSRRDISIRVKKHLTSAASHRLVLGGLLERVSFFPFFFTAANTLYSIKKVEIKYTSSLANLIIDVLIKYPTLNYLHRYSVSFSMLFRNFVFIIRALDIYRAYVPARAGRGKDI